MKAPDKIYLLKVELEERWPWITEASELEPETEECYIRKDALLEWAKEAYLNENASAIRKLCYKQLIDKIESL